MDEPASAWVMLFVAPVFIGIWCGSIYLIAWLSGWRRLAQRFAAAGEIDGQRHAFSSLFLGDWARYRNSLLVIVGVDGVYIRPALLFRFAHPALLIPWAAIARLDPPGTGASFGLAGFSNRPVTGLDVVDAPGGAPLRFGLVGAPLAAALLEMAPAALKPKR